MKFPMRNLLIAGFRDTVLAVISKSTALGNSDWLLLLNGWKLARTDGLDPPPRDSPAVFEITEKIN